MVDKEHIYLHLLKVDNLGIAAQVVDELICTEDEIPDDCLGRVGNDIYVSEASRAPSRIEEVSIFKY